MARIVIEQSQSYELHPGVLIQDRYEIIKQLGSGATGTVFECRDLTLGNLTVACKFIIPGSPQAKKAISRLDREIRALFRIQSPYVVKFFDLVRVDPLIGYTMELIEGGSLEDYRKNSTPLPLAWRVGVLNYISQGLAAIHSAGIIHRDIKPANILLNSQGFPKITDFGLARIATHEIEHGNTANNNGIHLGSRLSSEKALVGTPEFMSPESVMGNIFSFQSDIYSLGVTAYELLTGKAPYEFKNLTELLTLKANNDPIPPYEINREIPKALSDIVMKMMARETSLRYTSADQIVGDLQLIISNSRLSPLMHYTVRTPEQRKLDLAHDTGTSFHSSFGLKPIFNETLKELSHIFHPSQSQSGSKQTHWLILLLKILFAASFMLGWGALIGYLIVKN